MILTLMPNAVEQSSRVRLRRYAFENQHTRTAQFQHATTAGVFPLVTFTTLGV
jgi:hypothetical protein